MLWNIILFKFLLEKQTAGYPFLSNAYAFWGYAWCYFLVHQANQHRLSIIQMLFRIHRRETLCHTEIFPRLLFGIDSFFAITKTPAHPYRCFLFYWVLVFLQNSLFYSVTICLNQPNTQVFISKPNILFITGYFAHQRQHKTSKGVAVNFRELHI